ncbi:Nonribosomal peptide synthetase 12 [Colletotrichum higginsianum]|uniref:Nonribosomal peptide synthetase 12 n=1 Tax=Colletotrichum higginsianum TaxID=80884 RepID=A0A4V4NCX7_9PEZI|nr:Nonribosomal peptide synthetase 12 [Colletotrichum higginsianum]
MADENDGGVLQNELASVQQGLDIQNGPVFSARVLEKPDGKRLFFLVAHHLVVDLVSWRVIVDDLQLLLAGEPIIITAPTTSLSWGAWCRAQAVQLSAGGGGETLLRRHEAQVLEALRFWGMQDNPNVFADVQSSSVTMDKALTDVFLDAANRPLRTEPVEILATSLMGSFLDVFQQQRRQRQQEFTIFLEGHGRDLFPELDVSQTVGWFTTMFPLRLHAAVGGSFTERPRRVKDDRRMKSRAAMLDWAQILFRENNKNNNNSSGGGGGGGGGGCFAMPIEILLNYGGKVTSLDQTTGPLLSVTDPTTDFSLGDVSPDMARMALIEISAVVEGDQLRLSMRHNRRMNHQDGVRRWFREWINTLETQLRVLAGGLEESMTLADVPLLSLDCDDLARLELAELPARGLSVADIEDMYPCSALQQGILMSQDKGVGDYMTRVAWEVRGVAARPDEGDLERAWLAVVDRHDSLRTVFLDNPPYYTQAVLKTTRKRPEIRHVRLQSNDDDTNNNVFTKQNLLALAPSALDMKKGRGVTPPHCLFIVTTSDDDDVDRRRVGLVLSISHAVADEDSIDVLVRERELACAGKLPHGPGPSYRDFIALQMRGREASAAHWRSYVQSATPCLFPGRSDGSNDASPGARPHETPVPAVIDADLDFSAALHGFCRGSAVTLSDVAHVAWAAVLRVYTGCEAPMFGYLYSGRGANLAGVEHAVGAYVAMLVSRVPLDDDLPLDEAAQRAHDASIQVLQHAHCSLAGIQHELGLGALFNTGISLRRRNTAEGSGTTTTTTTTTAVSLQLMESLDATEYDMAITVAVDDDDDAVSISLAYRAEAVAWFQADKALALFLRALGIITLEPPSDAPAVHAWDGLLTYAELRRVCHGVAAQLVSRGVRPGDTVPVCFDKSLWYVVAVLGVLLSGAKLVPLDPALPQAAVDHILRSVSAGVAITSPRYESRVRSGLTDQSGGGGVIVLPDMLPAGNDDDDMPPSTRGIDLDATAYVIFTSGSTGRVLQFASSAFDVSVDEIVLTLTSGGCVCVPSDEARSDDLASAMAAMKVNTAMLTPSVARLLLHLAPDAIPTLRHVILGGEKVARQDLAAWSGRVARLDIVYGLTECAVASVLMPFVKGAEAAGCLGRPVGCAVWLVDPADENRLVPDGCTGERLIEGPVLASGYLGDPERTASAFISGPGWATDDSSSSSSSSSRRRRRFFRTGNLAWRDGGGVLHFEGRRDHQMKLRGLRFEAEDIEGHIARSWPRPGRRAFVDVVSRDDGSGRLRDMLVALIDDGGSPTGSDLEESAALHTSPLTEEFRQAAKETRRRLLEVVSAYMVPTLFIPINHMPMSVSGKTDRKRLKKLLQTLSMDEQMRALHLLPKKRNRPGLESLNDGVGTETRTDTETETETKTEGCLKATWARVLGSGSGSGGGGEEIDLDSHFFQIGGDSMTALRLSSALRADGFRLPVSAIFKTPVLRDMAEAMARWESPAKAEPMPEEEEEEEDYGWSGTATATAPTSLLDSRFEDVFPTTEFQSWCVNCCLADPRAYMTYFAMDVLGPLDPVRLRAAIQKTVLHLPILRTVFLSKNGDIFQAVLRSQETPILALAELDRHPQAELQTMAARDLAVADAAKSPFRLGTPVTGFTLISDPVRQTACLVMRLSHAQYNASSFSAMLETLRCAYSCTPLPAASSLAVIAGGVLAEYQG